MSSVLAIAGIVFFCFCAQSVAWSSGEKVKLTDVQVLTLHYGQQTTGRRSSPVPQLKCIGGSAGCSAFVPQVVQCTNKGSDGIDVQWDCKTDMDNAYRFGKIEVVCEGYDYPDDPYILKGSCGLEYSLDLTKEGVNQRDNTGSHNYYGSSNQQQPQPSTLGNIILLIIVGVIIYAVCVSYSRATGPGAAGTTVGGAPGDDWGSGGGGAGGGFQGGAGRPNPPGFRPEYEPGGCGGQGRAPPPPAGGGLGGFWGGAALGGLAGYLFGNRNGGGYNRGYNPGWGGGYAAPNRGFFGGGGFGGGGFGGSSGTRSASGFGGTRRR